MNKRDKDLELEKYYKQLKKYLPATKQTSVLMKNLRNSIDEYIDNHPDYSIQEIIDTFGSPEETAEFLVTSMDTKEFKKRLSLKNSILIGFVSLLALFLFVYMFAYIRGRNLTAVYETDEVINIETYSLTEGD